MNDEYRTVRTESLAEIKVQGSRFIGEALSAGSVTEAEQKLEHVRKREHAATHHCFAWRIGLDENIQFKYSDDGEPSGTAGRPIYDIILGTDLTDTLVVVTRYFGGTKLGTGGLAHAYSDTARAAIERAELVTRYVTALARVTLEFSLYDRLQRTVHKLEASIVDSQFSDKVSLTIEIRQSRIDDFRRSFVELTSGKGEIEIITTPTH